MVLVPEERGTIGACVIGVREVSQSSRVEVSEGGEEAQATLGTERGKAKKKQWLLSESEGMWATRRQGGGW